MFKVLRGGKKKESFPPHSLCKEKKNRTIFLVGAVNFSQIFAFHRAFGT
jgi:hypothetical protein